ncbi:MAG: choice-of-anchor I family protein [Pseudomonadota bacterium]|nr:choice-of-anchor I family protein [Pseudomonadota bacterium]
MPLICLPRLRRRLVATGITIGLTAAFPVALAGKPGIELVPLDTYATGIFDKSAAEIVAHDPASQRLFVVNGAEAAIDVLDASDPSNLVKLFAIDVSPYGKAANSVDVSEGVVAAALENNNAQANGEVVFFDTNGAFLGRVTVGALPDMLTFTHNGDWLLVANEGEPSDDYTVDPLGSVSIIDMRDGADDVDQSDVRSVDFSEFNNVPLDPSVRIFGPRATVAQDLEPEYIATSKNGRHAWVVMQENNAMARIDVRRAKVLDLFGLGFKDHSVAGNGIDASNKDGAINIAEWPVLGMYQPDAIGTYRHKGRTLIVTANEGDSRDYGGFSEEGRVKDLTLDPAAFPDAATLQMDENLGRLKITTSNGDLDGDGDFDELYAYGARSFSIRTAQGKLLYDSGDDFEQITAVQIPADFNSTNDENASFDNRSDDKGPEPEGLTLGKVEGRTYAFIGLERVGGIMVYDITNPNDVAFVQYINTRDFAGDPETGTAGDLGPEGLTFIEEDDSPTEEPLLAVASEVSGTVTLYVIVSKDDDSDDRDDDDDD